MAVNKRITFKCWQCGRNYSLFLELTGKPALMVECPFCGQEAVADLSPYQEDIVAILRSVSSGGKNTGVNLGRDLKLPDVIPTRQPEG